MSRMSSVYAYEDAISCYSFRATQGGKDCFGISGRFCARCSERVASHELLGFSELLFLVLAYFLEKDTSGYDLRSITRSASQ